MSNGSVITTRWLQSTYVMLRITYAENPKKQQGNSPLSSLDLQGMCLFSHPLRYHSPHLGRDLMPWKLVERLTLTSIASDRRTVSKRYTGKNNERSQEKKVTLFQWPLSNLCTNKGNVLKCCCLNKLFNEREYS